MAKRTVIDEAASLRNYKALKDEERVEFLHSGSTLFNLALSGKGKNGGWARGHIVNPVGDGSSGKTAFALELAAWCFYNIMKVPSVLFPPVKKVIIVYNNVEDVMDFPIEAMFGKRFVEGVEWIKKGTVESFGRDYARRVMALKEGEFLLYIVDSWDALTSEAGQERFIEAAEKDKPEDGSYGTEKAKYGSASFFSNICDISSGKDATLMIISQVRDKIDAVNFGKKKYRAGGGALNFYTHQVAWLAVVEKLSKEFRGDKRVYGIKTKAQVERNKVAKPFREAEITILFDYGVDDVGSMLSWYYGPKVEKIQFDGAQFTRAELIKYIEDNEIEDVLIEMVEKEWALIESQVAPQRKPRF